MAQTLQNTNPSKKWDEISKLIPANQKWTIRKVKKMKMTMSDSFSRIKKWLADKNKKKTNGLNTKRRQKLKESRLSLPSYVPIPQFQKFALSNIKTDKATYRNGKVKIWVNIDEDYSKTTSYLNEVDRKCYSNKLT